MRGIDTLLLYSVAYRIWDVEEAAVDFWKAFCVALGGLRNMIQMFFVKRTLNPPKSTPSHLLSCRYRHIFRGHDLFVVFVKARQRVKDEMISL